MAAATYLFLHDGIWHILFNMLFLWMFGADLETHVGHASILCLFFSDGNWGRPHQRPGKDACSIRMARAFSVAIPTIGASGAIYGVLLAAAIMFPDRQIWLIPFPVRFR